MKDTSTGQIGDWQFEPRANPTDLDHYKYRMGECTVLVSLDRKRFSIMHKERDPTFKEITTAINHVSSHGMYAIVFAPTTMHCYRAPPPHRVELMEISQQLTKEQRDAVKDEAFRQEHAYYKNLQQNDNSAGN